MAQDRSVAQTLSRGLQILEILADSSEPLTAQQLAEQIDVSRPIVYRLLRTLESHGLLDADLQGGKFDVGVGLLSLGRKLTRNLREAAFPEIQRLTRDYSATTFIGVRDGDEIVCALSCEPDSHALAIRHREGMRIPMKGASSWAILSSQPPSSEDSSHVKETRDRGYALSSGQVFPGSLALSVPLVRRDQRKDASLTMVFADPSTVDADATAVSLMAAASRISANYTF